MKKILKTTEPNLRKGGYFTGFYSEYFISLKKLLKINDRFIVFTCVHMCSKDFHLIC